MSPQLPKERGGEGSEKKEVEKEEGFRNVGDVLVRQ